jgi:hypothetical protein
MRRVLSAFVVLVGLLACVGAAGARSTGALPSDEEVRAAFARQGMRIDLGEAASIRDDVRIGLAEARRHGIGNSKVDFSALEIAYTLGLDTSPGSRTVKNVVAALADLHGRTSRRCEPRPPSRPPLDWSRYYERTLGLWRDSSFMQLVGRKGFHPVKISWEDIGRHAGSVWGDRISDVGIWVREDEADPGSSRLALSVRRDGNFRDKVLVVPASAIKVHERLRGRTVEKTLPERLAELGVASEARDRNVIVSNQFAIVPVPARGMHGAWADGVPPRAAFTFSIFPYGSTNLVITDVIEGSHVAIVGPGHHQLLYANVDGGKAPFTASRAEDRPDLLRLERELRAQGMDVDVQRYYLIQVPLRRGARGVRLSNMGTPPMRRAFEQPVYLSDAIGPVSNSAAEEQYGVAGGVEGGVPGGVMGGVVGGAVGDVPAAASAPMAKSEKRAAPPEREADRGLVRVAIGHGETEGPYSAGGGQHGARAEEPIRVTVVYFVTPVGEVTARDMQAFATAFARWDEQAIWGGSFVTKDAD